MPIGSHGCVTEVIVPEASNCGHLRRLPAIGLGMVGGCLGFREGHPAAVALAPVDMDMASVAEHRILPVPAL